MSELSAAARSGDAPVEPASRATEARDPRDTPSRPARAGAAGTAVPAAAAAAPIADDDGADRATSTVCSSPAARVLVDDPGEPGDRPVVADDGDAASGTPSVGAGDDTTVGGV